MSETPDKNPQGASLGKADPLPLPSPLVDAALASVTVCRVRSEFERTTLRKKREGAVQSEHDPVDEDDIIEIIGKLMVGVPARKVAIDLQLPELLIEGIASVLPLKAIKASAAEVLRKRMDEAVLYRAARLQEQVEKFKSVSEKVADASQRALDSIPVEEGLPSDKVLSVISTAAGATKAAYSVLEKATGLDRKDQAVTNVNVTTIASFDFPDDNPLAGTVDVTPKKEGE